MIAVIIAGGSGTRLWPLSTPDYPKHLLNVNGDSRSLLQITYDKAKLLTEKIYIVSETGHIGHVMAQLPGLPDDAFIVEPARRGTASCIVSALSHLSKKQNMDEPIIILPADHYVRDNDGFVHAFEIAAKTASDEGKIVLIGAEPTYPATSFGYIQKGPVLSKETYIFKVRSFKEKPNFETANNYYKNGKYLWNCGYFVGSLNIFLKSMKKYAPVLHENFKSLQKAKDNQINEVYLSFENNTIDYALIEHVEDLLVVPASFDWMDLGSFKELHRAVSNDSKGNHITGKNAYISDVKNSFIQNNETKPVVVIGLNNVVVVNTPEGILVARQDVADNVGDVSKTFGQVSVKKRSK